MSERTTRSVASEYQGPWMRDDILAALPQLRREFDMNRDPHVAAQLRDQDKTEAQRRREGQRYNEKLAREQNNKKPTYKSGTQTQSGDEEQGESGTSDARSSTMVARDQPKANLRPPEHVARAVGASHFNHSWLAEQRAAAMAQAESQQQHQNLEPGLKHAHEPRYSEPGR